MFPAYILFDNKIIGLTREQLATLLAMKKRPIAERIDMQDEFAILFPDGKTTLSCMTSKYAPLVVQMIHYFGVK